MVHGNIEMISSLLVRISPEADYAWLREKLAAMPGFEVGALTDTNRLPIVIESSDSATADQIYQQLCELPGILFVDIVAVFFDDLNSKEPLCIRNAGEI